MKNKIFLSLLLALLAASDASAAKISARERQRVAETLSRIVDREVAGARVKIKNMKASRGKVRIGASIDLSYYPFREESVRAMYDSVRVALPREFSKARIELFTDGREIGDLIPLAFRNELARKRMIPFTNRSVRPLVMPLTASGTPKQGLSGRHIALWQSHGRYFDQNNQIWKWQRSRLWETCEDLYTQSYVLPYLVPMLENAGACVMLPRERDVQKYEVLGDNDARGQYSEENGVEPWHSGGVGFAHLQQVYHTGENPFRQGTVRRVKTAIDGAESRAGWRVDIPEKGEYAVYVSYESTPESADDARYTVHHLGGESDFAVNQTMGGGTWIYLGHFLFDPGRQQIVTLSNRSLRPGRVVSADAVKVGGGYGNIARTLCDSLRVRGREYVDQTSGYPRFCEGARYWLQWAGFGEEVYTPKNNGDDYKDDFMSRAHWVNALMGGSERLPGESGLHIPVDMALAFHSDAGVRDGDGIVGTLGIFFTKDKNGKFDGGADRYRSRDLTDIVMTQIVGDIRRTYEPEWSRRGLWNRSYYEARVPNVPTMLLELLSHQNFADMRLGLDPRFKFVVSRAVYKGILKHIAAQYDIPYVVQPLPVERFATALSDDGRVRLTWTPTVDTLEQTATPTGYLVYTRIGDGGFDCGRYTETPSFTAEQEPGEVYSYKITALNDGGESFPSEILAACHVPDQKGRVLVVNGFERVSAPVSQRCDSLAGFYNDLDPGVPDKQDISFIGSQRIFDLEMARCEDDSRALGACHTDFETEVLGGNTFDYPYLHGKAIAASHYSFCSASVRAVEGGEVALTDYSAIDLILGKQRTTAIGRGVTGYEFRVFTPALQRALRAYLAQGGALFASGSYVATDLWTGAEATEADRMFAREVLGFEFDGSQPSEKNRVRVTTPNPAFARGEYRFCNEYSPDRYIVEASDALLPVGKGAFPVMHYADSGRTAAVASADSGRSVVLGIPFESFDGEWQRQRLMEGVLRFLLPQKR